MAIRYDQSLLEEIRRTVKNYQAKRQRVLNKGGEIIPDPAYVSTFLNDYTNRRELLRDLRKLQRYSIKGAEEVITLASGEQRTRYQISELKRLTAQAKRNITLELKQAPEQMQPLEQGYYENLRLRYQYLSRSVSQLSARQLRTFERIAVGEGDLDKKRRNFYSNIQTMIKEITFGMSSDLANKLSKVLSKVPMAKLTEMVQTDKYFSAILDWYSVIKGGGEIEDFENAVESFITYAESL